MKHIKTYENINEPQIGDYVLCEERKPSETIHLTKNVIGKFIDMNEENDRYIIKYDIIYPDNLKKQFYPDKKHKNYMLREEIKHWSKNKKELEIIANTNKYNI